LIVSNVKKKGNTVYIILGNDEKISVPYEVFLKHYIKRNDKITKIKLNEIENDASNYRIKQSCLRYLSGRNHSKYELQLKLLRKNYDKSQIDGVLNNFEKQGLIDDEEFSKLYFTSQIRKKRGQLKIKSDLIKKGIDRNTIEKISSGIYNEDAFIKNAFVLANNKCNQLLNRNIEPNKIKEKVYQFLAGRGFTGDIISKTMKQLNLELSHE